MVYVGGVSRSPHIDNDDDHYDYNDNYEYNCNYNYNSDDDNNAGR